MNKLYTIIFAFVLGCFSVNLQAQVAGANFDVIHYEIHLNQLDFTNHTLEAQTNLNFFVIEDLSQVVLELKTLQVTEVLCTEAAVADYSQEGDFLLINLSTPLQANTIANLQISYSGATFNESWGGFHWNGEYAYNLGVGFESVPHNLGKTWFPCVDDFVDKASYQLYVTVPNEKKAICGGLLVESIDNGDGTSTWHWSVDQEIPTYLISVAVGEYELWERTHQGIEAEIPITVYARPNQLNKVDGTFANIDAIISSFENWFGAYPFNRVGYISTSLGCMEHVDNIAMSSSLISGGINNGEEYYIAHELSHMWFGDKVTCATAGDMWLNEGFGTFAGHYYKRDLYGYDVYSDEMRSLIYNITKGCHLSEGWIPLNNMPDDLTYGTTVYDKGATVVHTMMNYLGEDLFYQAMKFYLSEFAYASATSEQLRDAISYNTGVDMTHFFENWVFTPGSPHYSIDSTTVTPVGNQFQVDLYMNSKHRGADHIDLGNRYEVGFLNADWELHTENVSWANQSGHITKTLDFNPLMVLCDPYEKTADARTDEIKRFYATGEYNYSKAMFRATVNEISDSVFFCVDQHWVGPMGMQNPHPALTLSEDRYWTIHRLDAGSANITGRFQYSRTNAYDQNLIQTQNDSVVLLYRENTATEWHSIPYTVEGVWNIGYFHVDNIQSGDYVLAVWDKQLLSVDEDEAGWSNLSVYPNPAEKDVTVNWNQPSEGTLVIYDVNGKLLKSIAFEDTSSIRFSTKGLSSGVYYLRRITTDGKIVGFEKMIVR